MKIEEWLLEIIHSELPQEPLTAYHIGVYENLESTYVMYLIGSKNYSSTNGNWVNEVDFEPELNYIPLNEEGFHVLDSEELIEVLEQRLRNFTKTDTFKSSFLGNARAFTVGNELGPIYRIL